LKDQTGTLQEILEIARRQQELLDRGDLDAARALQAARQQLLNAIQSLDAGIAGRKSILSEIVAVDRKMGLLLSAEVTDIQRKIQRITSLKKLLHAPGTLRKRTPRHVSRRI
jgi:hypothetical protein